MSLLSKIFDTTLSFRSRQIDAFRKNPVPAQDKVFAYLMRKGKNTEWGKQYDYASIKNIESYQQRIPIQEYDQIKPYIDRMRQGQQNVLWPSTIKWFAKSSGTTGSKSKFIPVSREALLYCHIKSGQDLLKIYRGINPKSKILSAKTLTLGGSYQADENGNGKIKYGDLSAILIQNIPNWANKHRVPSREVALLPDFEQKIKLIAEQAVKQDIVAFMGVPSWNLMMMKYILEYTKKDNLLEVWPNLEFFAHGGVSFTPYREQFEKIIPSPSMHYMETYNASEGFFALQDDLNDPGMLLLPDLDIFYEFIPLNELDKDNPTVHTLADVKVGEVYAMIISTNAGLWRYKIGDTVEFTSLCPHKIKVAGRTKHYINVFGEELMIGNAEAALKTACEKTGAVVREYTAAPIFMTSTSKGGHEWLIEFEVAPADLEQFADELDKALCALNSDYEAKRAKNITLNRLVLRSLKSNTFYEWMKQIGKLGGQNKVPRLFNTREYVNQLLEINHNL